MIVSVFTATVDSDIYPLRNLIRPRYAERIKPGRDKPVLNMHIGFIASFYDSLEHSRFSKIAIFISFPCSTQAVGIAHKPPS